jgi:hypothetical protein
VFFNDEMPIQNPVIRNRGRQQQEEREVVVPKVKRNLTPDEHLKAPAAESYLLVDNFGQPRKIYLKRNLKVIS